MKSVQYFSGLAFWSSSMSEENMPTNLEEYLQVRIAMQAKRQEIQRKLAATNRALFPWQLIMGGLLVLIIGSGIAAKIFASGWLFLTTLGVLGGFFCIILFYSSTGKRNFSQFWKLRDELIELDAHQHLIEEIWQEMLPKDVALRTLHHKTFKNDEQAFTEFAQRAQHLIEQQRQRQSLPEQKSDRKV
jgi:hypothetical protein